MTTIIIRAAIVAIIIGTILTLVNQSGWIAGTEPLQVLQLILVFALPFGVVTVAQLAGVREARRDVATHGTAPGPEGFASIVMSHGIPARAVAISLFFGSLNASLVVANTLVHGGDLATIAIVPLGQAFVLPLVFGLLSQALTYRRLRFQPANAT